MHGPPSILPLSLRDVSLAVRGRTLVDRLSFTLDRGGRTVILGPNGSGKTLTLRLCHGLVAPTSGHIEWQGDPGRFRARRHAMVFQHPVMLRRSARANILHALSINGLRRRERHARADTALARFGLAALAERPARVLSGGERQRLALARAWALKPEVVFLDEPTSALDPAATKAIEELVQSFEADGVKVVMSTHDLGQARRLADEVLFLHRGRLIEHGSAAEFFSAPRTAEARAFLQGDLFW